MRPEAVTTIFAIAVFASVLPLNAVAQTTVELPPATSRVTRTTEWPQGPDRASVPEWAQNGLIRFARWDGGRIETVKAILSGWPNFWPPDPDYLYTTDHWYDLKTVHLLREVGVNMVWVTFSTGFSNQTEKLHQDEVARYLRECHRQGIHVMAYESSANIFWQDMFKNVPGSRNWVLLDKNGKPTPYGAAAYAKVGYVSRYVADPANSEWLAYLRQRVNLALDAGADGVMYDNNVDDDLAVLAHLYRTIYRYGSGLKKDFLLMGNFHDTSYVLNRVTNCMTTEDAVEPGIYDPQHAQTAGNVKDLLPVGGGFLVDNVGLFRLLDSLSKGWKLNLVENGAQEFGAREALPMSPERRQLAMAEAVSFGATDELFVEDALANGLWNTDPKAIALWNSIAKYNRFFADHEQYYTGTRSLAPLAIVLDDSSGGVDLLNNLAARNVLFDVIYAHDLKPGMLSRYTKVAVLNAETVSDSSLEVLEKYVRDGGRLFMAGKAASRDEKGRERPRTQFFDHKIGNGNSIYFDRIPPINTLAENLKQDVKTDLPKIHAPVGVVYNILDQPQSRRLIVHLLNYTASPIDNVVVELNGKYRSATVLSPDRAHDLPVAIHQASARFASVSVPRLKIYSLVVLNK